MEQTYGLYNTRNEKWRIYIIKWFLYEAIYIPEGIEPPPKSVIECLELQEYIVEFGENTTMGGLESDWKDGERTEHLPEEHRAEKGINQSYIKRKYRISARWSTVMQQCKKWI